MSSPVTTFDERYSVIQSRDPRFDGQFVTAVRSTGIYCRPSCPARTPKESNVTFYATSAAAHEAGYRACKRCLPEAAPGSPAWNIRGDTTARAMRLIADGVVEREGVPGLAHRLGYSTRHLTRLLTAELGAGPLALSRAHRAHTARMLLVGTDLPAADVAFSAGFASVRQFNETIREVFGMPPLEVRARRRRPASGAGEAPGSIDLVLPHRGPLDADGLFAWMIARVDPRNGDGHTARPSLARCGSTAVRRGSSCGSTRADGVRLRAKLTALRDLPAVVARARRLFDLDADPIAVDEALARHPELAPLVARIPGIRVPGAIDPHEMLIRAMVGQQITVSAARTALTALTEALGERIEGFEGASVLFPTMAAIAERGHEVLRGPAARTRSLIGAAAALADGSLTLTTGDDGPTQRAALLAMPGIGPWTADYVRMRVLGDPDIVLPGGCRRARGRRGSRHPLRSRRTHRVGCPHRALAQLPDRAPLGGRPDEAAAPRTRSRSASGDDMSTATIQTIDTPDGAFTIVADDRGRVLASGWTADPEAALARIGARLRPSTIVAGETDAASAARAYYDGDLGAIDGIEVAQSGTEMQLAGWSALRSIAPGAPLSYAGLRRRAGAAERGAGSGIHLRSQRTGAVRAVPPGAALRRVARRLRLGAGRQALAAGARSRVSRTRS